MWLKRIKRILNSAKNRGYKQAVLRLSLIMLLVLGISLMISGSTLYIADAKVIPIKLAKIKPITIKPRQPTINLTSQLVNNINNILDNAVGFNFEVSVTNLSNNQQLNFGPGTPMTAASVSKILTAADLLNQVELGKESLNEILPDGNTASYDLQTMITISSDPAWDTLNDELGYPQLQDYANSLGLTSFSSAYNTLSARDTVKLLTDLYDGKLLNYQDTQLILAYMKVANYRNYIVPAVPPADTVYHKIGLWDGEVNDAAIISNQKTAIAMAIFSHTNSPNSDTALLPSLFQQITKLILSYENLL